MTCHREENTNDDAMRELLLAMEALDAPVIFPAHPRSVARAERIAEKFSLKNTWIVKAVSYLTSIGLVKNAKKIITDSGGIQREAFFAGVQCVTIFDHVAWPETMVGNRNQLARMNRADILDKLRAGQTVEANYKPFGDGRSGEKILFALRNMPV
jgi:UDP-N-acetylglucosamine 2-epimerase (non-hydrolysing)/UDP-GlcNAc3NAcA epimerase